MSDGPRLLIADMSVNPVIYRPVVHWQPHVEALGVPFDVCRPPDGEAPADLGPYSHAILTGSEASILADTEWIVRACELTRALAARGVKLLGSWCGHQMLGRALAGRAFVRRTPTPEFGWVELRKRDGGTRDPLADALPARCDVYTSHCRRGLPGAARLGDRGRDRRLRLRGHAARRGPLLGDSAASRDRDGEIVAPVELGLPLLPAETLAVHDR